MCNFSAFLETKGQISQEFGSESAPQGHWGSLKTEYSESQAWHIVAAWNLMCMFSWKCQTNSHQPFKARIIVWLHLNYTKTFFQTSYLHLFLIKLSGLKKVKILSAAFRYTSHGKSTFSNMSVNWFNCGVCLQTTWEIEHVCQHAAVSCSVWNLFTHTSGLICHTNWACPKQITWHFMMLLVTAQTFLQFFFIY